jgi:hypothetical protein
MKLKRRRESVSHTNKNKKELDWKPKLRSIV